MNYLLGVALILTAANGIHVDTNIRCDNHLAIFYSTDNFATYETIKNPKDNPVADPFNNAYATYSFDMPHGILRLGCWDYGGGRYLVGKVTIDGVDHPFTPNGDYELVGWERTCENPDICSNFAECHKDIPDTLTRVSSISLVTPGQVLVAHSGGYWPQGETGYCGIFWVDVDLSAEVNVVTSLHCDNHLGVFYSVDNFASYETINNPKDNKDSDSFNNKVARYAFTMPSNAVLRFACWDYGGGRYLVGKISIDGVDYTFSPDGDYHLVGWEETCLDPNVCKDFPECHKDIPDTFTDVSSVSLANPDEVLVAHSGGYWPQSETSHCGVFFVDFGTCEFEEYEYVDGECVRRDCDTFAIDEYLVGCSQEFAATTSDISDLEQALEEEIAAREAAIAAEKAARDAAIAQEVLDRDEAIAVETAARVAAIAKEVVDRDNAIDAAIAQEVVDRDDAIDAAIAAERVVWKAAVAGEKAAREDAEDEAASERQGLEVRIVDLKERMDRLRPLSAKAYAVGMNPDMDDGFWASYKDLVVVTLLVLNAVLMMYFCCVVRVERREGRKYQKVMYEDDSEACFVNK